MTQNDSNPKPPEPTLGNLGALLGPTPQHPAATGPQKQEPWWREDVSCETCHDGKFIRLPERSVLGSPNFGRVVPCPDCAGVSIIALGIPYDLLDASFENYDLRRTPEMKTALRAVRLVADGEQWCALLAGAIGVGKSHLASAALRFNKLPKPGRFWQVGDLLRQFRGAMFSGDETARQDEDQLVSAWQRFEGLLVLDDLGAGTPDSNFTDRTIFAIINARYTERRPTIITTNEVSKLDERILSRCQEGYVPCDGVDQRGKR